MRKLIIQRGSFDDVRHELMRAREAVEWCQGRLSQFERTEPMPGELGRILVQLDQVRDWVQDLDPGQWK
jgi:hypothetical protein